MPDLENRFKGFISEGERKNEESQWKPKEEKGIKKPKKLKSKNFHPIIFLLIMLGILFAYLGGGYLYLNQGYQKSKESLEKPVASNVPAATPVDLEVSKENIKILVLNGTGVRGQAGKVQTSLEGIGYKLIDVDTADSVVEQTLIEYNLKIGLKNIEEIKLLLEKTYLKVDFKGTEIEGIKITTGSLKKS